MPSRRPESRAGFSAWPDGRPRAAGMSAPSGLFAASLPADHETDKSAGRDAKRSPERQCLRGSADSDTDANANRRPRSDYFPVSHACSSLAVEAQGLAVVLMRSKGGSARRVLLRCRRSILS